MKWYVEESKLVKHLETNQAINRMIKRQRARHSSSQHLCESKDQQRSMKLKLSLLQCSTKNSML